MKSIFILFYLMLFMIKGEYISNYNIKTSFKTNDELIKLIDSPFFFDSYLERIGASQIEYDPVAENNSFVYPQNVHYKFTPNINFIPSFLLKKINVHHNWNKLNHSLHGKIESELLSFNLTLEPYNYNESVYLNMTGIMIDKKSFIPNKVMDHMLNEFQNIFKFIISNQ
jgi:hypothetical protein